MWFLFGLQAQRGSEASPPTFADPGNVSIERVANRLLIGRATYPYLVEMAYQVERIIINAVGARSLKFVLSVPF